MKKLKIKYYTVDGWNNSGGRSNNIWGQVPTSNLPLKLINSAIKNGTKSCIWTCYDDVIYGKLDDNGMTRQITIDDLPKTISATFKPTYSKYSAVAENMGMKIAVILDMPTSYNYIVKFEHINKKSGFKNIIKHLNERDLKNLQPYGIVSIDFLKPTNENVIIDKVYSGNKLISFEDSMRIANLYFCGNTDEPFWVETWIKSLEKFIMEQKDVYMADCTHSNLCKQVKKVKSRIVRSYLLREFLGDCDFTDRNCGFIFDTHTQQLQFAPNFDYGESFNALIKTKLDFLPPKEELEVILKWDKDFIKKKIEKSKIPVTEIAKRYSSSTSEKNLSYITENYKEDTKEFLDNLKDALTKDKFSNLINTYTKSTNNEAPMLSINDAEIFKKYINDRANWLIKTLNQSLNYSNYKEL